MPIMPASIDSLLATGTKLYLDSVHPAEIEINLEWGATGATSNPAIISEIVKTGICDEQLRSLMEAGCDDSEIAWALTAKLVSDAQQRFIKTWQQTAGNEGWVSFELDPLLEDPANGLSPAQRTEQYVQLGKHWAKGQQNRMIKVPATPAGIAALEELAAAGVTLNVTLIFTVEQYRAAREAVQRGFLKRADKSTAKSVYSVFISRIDVYADQFMPQLADEVRGQVGILNAKRIWQENLQYWKDKGYALQQEIIFASTGTKKKTDAPWKYVAALAGSDIQTNPPETNKAVAENKLNFTRQVDLMPDANVQTQIDQALDVKHMHEVLMQEGIAKFVKPQQALLELIAEKRKSVTSL
jgi:transaldolase